MINKLRYEVFEDNGGGITMFVLADGTPIYGHSGYEYTPASLKEDIKELESSNSVNGWDGNGVYTGLEFINWEDMDGCDGLQGCYDEFQADEYVDLIADSDGIYPDNMGAMAAEIFEISEE